MIARETVSASSLIPLETNCNHARYSIPPALRHACALNSEAKTAPWTKMQAYLETMSGMEWCRSAQLQLHELAHYLRNKQTMKLIPTFLHFRSSLCMAIVSAFKIQDPSTPLLSTLAASLLTSFNPSEVFSDSAKHSCSLALLNISQLSRDGHLQGLTATSQTLAEVISLYTIMPATDKGSRLLSSTDNTVYPVETAVRVR